MNTIKAKPARRLYRSEFRAKSARFSQNSRRVKLRVTRLLNHKTKIINQKASLIDTQVTKLINVDQYIERMGARHKFELFEGNIRILTRIDALVESIESERMKIVACETLGKRIFTKFHPTTSGVSKDIQVERDLHTAWNTLNRNQSTLEQLANQVRGTTPPLRHFMRIRKIGTDKI